MARRKYGPGQFDRVMEDNGGRNNAYTTEDLTVYQDWFPPQALPLIFDLEADRTRDLSFDPKMVESERGVVGNERRLSVENNNQGLLQEQLQAAAFNAHPYHWPVVGWMSDIENWKREDLMDYYKIYYAPNNCEMVIVGDIQARPGPASGQGESGANPRPARPATGYDDRTRAAGRTARHAQQIRPDAALQGGVSLAGGSGPGFRSARRPGADPP